MTMSSNQEACLWPLLSPITQDRIYVFMQNEMSHICWLNITAAIYSQS